MLKLGIVGEGNDGIAPLTGCPVEPTSKLDQYTTITLLLSQRGTFVAINPLTHAWRRCSYISTTLCQSIFQPINADISLDLSCLDRNNAISMYSKRNAAVTTVHVSILSNGLKSSPIKIDQS